MEVKKVNPNSPTIEFVDGAGWSNIPIRLDIASKILAGMASLESGIVIHEASLYAMKVADALIDCHNRGVDAGTDAD